MTHAVKVITARPNVGNMQKRQNRGGSEVLLKSEFFKSEVLKPEVTT